MGGGRDGDAAIVVTVGVEERDGAGQLEVGPQVEYLGGAQRPQVHTSHHLAVCAPLVSHPQLHQAVLRHCGVRRVW